MVALVKFVGGVHPEIIKPQLIVKGSRGHLIAFHISPDRLSEEVVMHKYTWTILDDELLGLSVVLKLIFY